MRGGESFDRTRRSLCGRASNHIGVGATPVLVMKNRTNWVWTQVQPTREIYSTGTGVLFLAGYRGGCSLPVHANTLRREDNT